MQTAASRALLLLCAACPETPPEVLAELPVGRRDALLLTLREWAFGPQLKGLASCPSCANTLDLEFATSDILLPAANGPATVAVEYAGADWTFRVPNSRDLAAISRLPDLESARQALIRGCLVDSGGGAQIPVAVEELVAQRMAEADPQADIRIDLRCPECATEWQAPFDIVSYFWQEIQVHAKRLLREVHVLASRYGWSEPQILALSAMRRQHYLEMVAS